MIKQSMNASSTTDALEVKPQPVLDFSGYITDRAHGFVGREWVFAAIQKWLVAPSPTPFLLLTGEPGSGKTAISARLAQFSSGEAAAPAGLTELHPGFLSAFHFFWGRDLLWIDPRTFCRSLGMQMAARYPEYMAALLEENNEGQIRIDVQQEAKAVTGQMIGFVLSELKLGQVSPEIAFNRVVRAPLEKFLRTRPQEKLVILLDAVHDSMIQTPDVSIVQLLARSATLPEGVRFILTSRPDPRVTNLFQRAERLDVSAAQHSDKNRADLRTYVQGRLERENLVLESKAIPGQLHAVVNTIAGKADDNFQYARLLLDDLASGRRSPNDLDSLPAGLNELYYDSLSRIVELGSKDWSTQYGPVVGVLTVSRVSQSVQQLMSFTALNDSTVSACLEELRQFLQVTTSETPDGQKEPHYTLFHQSFIDMLQLRNLSQEGEFPNTFRLPPAEQHQRIVSFYRGTAASWKAVDWSAVDDYGLLYISSHLYDMRDSPHCRDSLYQLVCQPLMKEKRARSGLHRLFLNDLELAITAARSEKPANFLQLARCALISATLSSTVHDIPPMLPGTLTRCGYGQYALDMAFLIPDPKSKSEAYLAIGEAFLEKRESESARGALVLAVSKAEWYQLTELALPLAKVGEFNRIPPLIVANEDPVRAAEIATRVICKLASSNQLPQVTQLAHALNDAGKLVPSLRYLEQSCTETVTPTPGSLDPFAEERDELVRGLALAADSFAKAGNTQKAEELARKAMAALIKSTADWSMMVPLCTVAPILAGAQEFAPVVGAAQRIAEESLKRESHDPFSDAPEDPPQRTGDGSDDFEKASSLVRKTEQMMARIMAMQFTQENLVSQVPEAGSIQFKAPLSPDNVRANALSWLAQTLAASEPPVPPATVESVLTALDQIESDSWVKPIVLAYLSLISARAGDHARAAELIDRSFAVLRKVPTGFDIWAFVLRGVAPSLALIGQLKRALGNVREISSRVEERDKQSATKESDRVLLETSRSLAWADQAAEAVGVARLVQDLEIRTKLFCEVAAAQVRAKDTENASVVLAAIGELENSFAGELPERNSLRVLAAVADALSKLNETDRAARLAAQIIQTGEHPEPEAGSKCKAMIKLAQALAHAGGADRAMTILDAVLAISSQALIENGANVEVSCEAATLLAELAQVDRALAALARVEDDWKNKAYALAAIGSAAARAGDFDQALEIVGSIRYPLLQADALGRIAEQMLPSAADRAAEIAGVALQLTSFKPESPKPEKGQTRRVSGLSVEGSIARGPSARGRLLSVLSRAGKRAEALAAAEADLQAATGPAAVIEASRVLIELGEVEKALVAVRTTCDNIREAGPIDVRSGRVLSLAAIVLARSKQFAASESLAEIIGAIELHDSPTNLKASHLSETWRMEALRLVAEALFDTGDREGAARVLDLAIAAWSALRDPRNKSRVVGNIISTLEHIKQHQRAMSFWELALQPEALSGRVSALNAIGAGAPALAAADGGEALWTLYQTFTEVESWWDSTKVG